MIKENIKIGFIGAGYMGYGMAHNLLKKNYLLSAYLKYVFVCVVSYYFLRVILKLFFSSNIYFMYLSILKGKINKLKTN